MSCQAALARRKRAAKRYRPNLAHKTKYREPERNEKMEEYLAENAAQQYTESQGQRDESSAEGSDAAAEKSAPQEARESNFQGEELSRTQAFSRRLNEMSKKKAEEAAEQVRREYDGFDEIVAAARELGLEGGPEEIAALIRSFEQEESQSEEVEDSQLYLDPVVLEARRVINEAQFAEDLAAIKQAYPEEHAGSVWELGDVYIQLAASGTVDALTAYEAAKAYEARTKAPVPPSTGSAKSNGGPVEKEFYTPDEVDRLTPRDYDDPKIMERVRKSMTKWS